MFSIRVLKDERIIVIAEQRPECAEEEVRRKALLRFIQLTFFYGESSIHLKKKLQ